jgi:hypothetical protein
MTTHSANLADTRYGSLGEFLAAASLPPRNPKNLEFTNSADNERDSHWSDRWTGGANTTSKALAAMSGQYASGAAIIKRIERAAAHIKLPPKMDLRRRRVRGSEGDDLDIFAVYRGRLDIAWERTQRRPITASPMVSIVVNTICNGGEDASVISFRGAVGIVLAQLLERFGYRVRIVFAMGGNIIGGNEKFSVRAVLKDYGKPVNQEAIACATHPALFRVMGHRWMWAHATKPASHGGAAVKEAIQEDNEIYISHEVKNERGAIDKIQSVIRDLTK